MERLEKFDGEQQCQIDNFLELQWQKREDKILMGDLNATTDLDVYAYMKAQKTQILQKKMITRITPPASNMFGEFFNNIGGDRADMLPYKLLMLTLFFMLCYVL